MSGYFSHLPNFEYVSRLPNAKISDYLPVKNLFKKGVLREDIFQNLAVFSKYKIKGNDRPDNVAYEVYKDSSLDWVILLSNNIVNIQTEWPLTQTQFDEYLLEKYENYDNIYGGIHHYETQEVKNSDNIVIVPAGLRVDSDYTITYYDFLTDTTVTKNPVILVTNYEYEERIENDKRNIYVLKDRYLNIVMNDMRDNMEYKKGSSQYRTETLKTADNIRLFQ